MVIYVLAGLVALALIVFFVTRKKPSQPTLDGVPETSRSLDSAQSAATPQKVPDRGSEEKVATHAASDQTQTEEQLDSLQQTAVAQDTESEAPEEDLLDSSPESLESEHPSPPPPPARDGVSAAGGQPLGRKAELQSLRRGLAKSRESEGFFGRLKGLLGGKKEIAPEIAEEIEEILLTSDVGVATTEALLERIKDRLKKGELKDEAQVWEALREEARRILSVDGKSGGIVASGQPTVVLMVGVNGAGKTTTIGKLAAQFRSQGKKVMLAAGDTFRAAAVDQLKAWGERVECDVIAGKENADPSSVLYDAIVAAKDNGADILLADTAGRLHTKTNLMQEMTKIEKTAGKALDGAPHEVLLVIDATNGQNAMAQAKEFKQALNITGLILTKLDGTARGGAVLGICDALQIPVRYIGVGERTEQLYEFDIYAFVEALLGSDEEEVAA